MENQISKKIKETRLRKNLSIDTVAVALEITPNAYRKIEMNYTKISVRRLYDLAEIFELEVTDLLNIAPEKRVNDISQPDHHSMQDLYNINKELYENQIEALKEEIHFLREQVLKRQAPIITTL